MQMIFKITNLERTIPSGVVFNIHYNVDAIDGEFIAGAYGSVAVAGDPNTSDFIPFNELTEEKVVDWVINQLGQEKLVEIESALAKQIELKKNPKSAHGIPWVTE